MLDVKEATRIAREYFDDLYADAQVSNVLLEEVERGEAISSEGESSPLWHITLGFNDETPQGGLTASLNPDRRRYKRFEIDAETGEVKAMKIRSVGNA